MSTDTTRTVYARTGQPPAHRDAPRTVVVKQTPKTTKTSTAE